MPINKCVVTGCSSRDTTARLFMVPNNDALRDLWLYYLLPGTPSLGSLTKDQLVRKKVCHLHFEDKYIHNNKRVSYGCPTLFTPDEILSRQPSKRLVTQSQTLKSDHSYTLLKPDNTDSDVDDVIRRLFVINNDHSYSRKNYTNIANKQLDYSLNPSPSSENIPSTTTGMTRGCSPCQVSTSSVNVQSTSGENVPSTSSINVLSTSSEHVPSTSSEHVPSTSSEHVPSTSSVNVRSTLNQDCTNISSKKHSSAKCSTKDSNWSRAKNDMRRRCSKIERRHPRVEDIV